LSLEDARRIVDEYVAYYNEVRLHSAIGYVTPKDRLEGRQEEIFAVRQRKLAEAKARRRRVTPAEAEAAVAGGL
jgi:putative transposase